MRTWVAASSLVLLASCTCAKPNFPDAAIDGARDEDAGPDDGPDAGPCPDGFAECDGDLEARCEADLTAPAHCGSCALACGPEDTCVEGACRPPRIQQLALGDDFTCALLDTGRVYCFGGDHRGQLGDGATTGDVTSNRPEPMPVVGLEGCTAVYAGSLAACAICGVEASVSCWGLNVPPRFGLPGASGTTPTPVPLRFDGPPATLEELDQEQHLCARSASAVYCSGRNLAGQLGYGDATTATVELGAVSLPGTPVSVTTGYSQSQGFTLVALTDGAVYCFGASNDSECGGEPATEVRTPARVEGLEDVVQVAAGSEFACALDRAGDVYCWGKNHDGQLGNGEVGSVEPDPSPVMGLTAPVGRLHVAGTTVIAVSADEHAVYGWGNNSSDQLGTAEPNVVPIAQAIFTEPAATFEAALGPAHVCVVRREPGEDDELLCAGSNRSYQRGAVTIDPPTPFAPVPDFP